MHNTECTAQIHFNVSLFLKKNIVYKILLIEKKN
jgi:hypothetical protein